MFDIFSLFAVERSAHDTHHGHEEEEVSHSATADGNVMETSGSIRDNTA